MTDARRAESLPRKRRRKGIIRAEPLFHDPSEFKGTYQETMIVFRCVRDEIEKWVKNVFGKTINPP